VQGLRPQLPLRILLCLWSLCIVCEIHRRGANHMSILFWWWGHRSKPRLSRHRGYTGILLSQNWAWSYRVSLNHNGLNFINLRV
jgi:hypothetical protein